MSTMGEEGGMDMLEIRRILKERYRKAHNIKSCSAETKEAMNTSSFFSSSECSLAPRLIDDSDALMPEMVKILEKMDGHQMPAKATKANYGVVLKTQRGKKLKESRDYSSLLSETSEVPKVSKPTPPPKTIPKADGNGVTRKSQPIPKADRNGVPKKSGDVAVSKDSGSKSLESKPRENMVTKSSQAASKQSLNSKQAELSDIKVMPRKEGPSLKRKLIKKSQGVDVSSIIQEIMGKRGNRRYKDYGVGGDDRAMVSGFNDILQEENRSARIARKEDATEALRLEQEAKQERLNKAKKQKLMN